MPEQDINEMMLTALLDRDTELKLLDNKSRMELLGALMLKKGLEFTPIEMEKLMAIEANSLQAFAQACMDSRLVTPSGQL